MMEYTPVNMLSTSRDNWVIKVRVTRIWDSINPNTNQLISMNMIFVGAEGVAIHATIRRNFVAKFRPLLEEGNVYMISNFRVENYKASDVYRPLRNNSCIAFLLITSVVYIREPTIEIPLHKFEFSTFDDALKDRYLNTNLSDMIGMLTSIANIQNINYKGATIPLRNIEICTAEGAFVKIGLWGGTAHAIDESVASNIPVPIIVIVTSLAVKTFKGDALLRSTTATNVYVDLDVVETINLKKCFADRPVDVQLVVLEDIVKSSDEATLSTCRLTVQQILELTWDVNRKSSSFTCLAVIKSIESNFGWYYIGCEKCSRKVKHDNSFWCSHCDSKSEFPTPRFRIPLKVEDDTGSATFVLFNKEAERLLNASAKDLANKSPLVMGNSLPNNIKNLVGLSFVFGIKVTDYNWKEGSQLYTIERVYNLDRNTHTIDQLDRMTMGTLLESDVATPTSFENCFDNRANVVDPTGAVSVVGDSTSTELSDDVIPISKFVKRQMAKDEQSSKKIKTE